MDDDTILIQNDNEYAEKGRFTPTLIFSALSASIGSCLIFGYSIGVLNSPEDVLRAWINESHQHLFHVDNMSQNLNDWIFIIISSILLIGGAIGSLTSGLFADKYGRKNSLLLNNFLLVVALIFFGLAKHVQAYPMLIAGRFVMGLHNGLSTGLLPMYSTEISPQNLRGAFGGITQMSIVIGVLIAQILGLEHMLGSEKLWPLLLCFPAVFAIVQVVSLPFLPESPKHLLINKGDSIKANDALIRLRGTEDVKEELEHLINVAERMRRLEEVHFLDLFTVKKYQWPILISIMMMMSQQLGGINAVMFYSTSIFKGAGLSELEAQYGTIGVGTFQLIITLIAVVLIEVLGRRTLHLAGLSLQLVFCIGLYTMLNVDRYTSAHWSSVVGIVFTILFVGAFCLGPGPIPWFFVNELFESNARGHAASIAVMFNWSASFIVTLGYPKITSVIDQHSFLIFIVCLVILILFTLKFVPETKGIPIHDIVGKFKTAYWKKWPVWQ